MKSKAKDKTLHNTRNDLDREVRTSMISLLNQALADGSDLKSQTKQAHWNVKGMNFYALHELFDKLAAILEELIDVIAERATALGGEAMGTARMAAKNSTLPEFPSDLKDGADFVTCLADRYAQYGAFARQAIDTADEAGDVDTADLFTDVSRAVDKALWFLEAHLQG